MTDSSSSTQQLRIFQRNLDLDNRHLAAVNTAAARFVSLQDSAAMVASIRDLLQTQGTFGPFLEFRPLFHFDSSFWLSQLFVRLLANRQNDFFAALDGQGKITSALRSRVLPNFEFIFVPAQIAAGGFYLQEADLNIRILYFDIDHQRLFAYPNGLLDLFNSDIGRRLSDRQLSLTVQAINDLADALLEDQFALDLNLLQTENDAQLEVSRVDLPVAVTDKLFILAQANQVDIVALDDGFLLNFNSSLKLYFTQVVDRVGHAQWCFRVSDDHNDWSFLAVLFEYSWFRNWYLDNIHDLQIAYRDEFFFG